VFLEVGYPEIRVVYDTHPGSLLIGISRVAVVIPICVSLVRGRRVLLTVTVGCSRIVIIKMLFVIISWVRALSIPIYCGV